MAVSNRELIGFFLELEEKLQASHLDVVDYLPVIRSYIYFSQRQTFSSRLMSRENFSRVSRSFNLVESGWRVFCGLFSKIRQTQLFVAPARHRNTLVDGGYVSKHLDSMLRVYGGEHPLVWEAGPNPNLSAVTDVFPRHVSLVATILSRLVIIPGKIKAIKSLVIGVLEHYPVQIDFDLTNLGYHLIAYDLSRAYYRRIFKGSSITVAYVVVYYSFRHAPIISALNELGIQTLEYQHGIQNNIHPLYTHWEHLGSAPKSLPAKVLVWDEVSERRIGVWAHPLGIRTEIVGNLWCSRQASLRQGSEAAGAIMVAVQIFPENFNLEVLVVIKKMPEQQWIFREHPVYPMDYESKKALRARYPNLEIVGSQDESVEATLARSFCCITGFSTVGVEALLWGRKTIFTHENARDGLTDYIDGERCFYADTAEDILAILQRERD